MIDEKIDQAILNAVAMIRPNCRPEEAMKFSQAALNLAHAKTQLQEKQTGTRGSALRAGRGTSG
jgi:hypothetical protein